MMAIVLTLALLVASGSFAANHCDEEMFAQETLARVSEAFPEKEFVVLKPARWLDSMESARRFIESIEHPDLHIAVDARLTSFWLDLLHSLPSHPELPEEASNFSYEFFVVGQPSSRKAYEQAAGDVGLVVRFLEVDSSSLDECTGWGLN